MLGLGGTFWVIYAALHPGWVPTQKQLDAAIVRASQQWNAPTNVAGIELADIGKCSSRSDRIAYADLATGTIRLNSNCRWSPGILRIVAAHEYGHLVLRSSAHSLDRRSVMFWAVQPGQKVLSDDLERLHEIKLAQ